jgi:hypothetical protein
LDKNGKFIQDLQDSEIEDVVNGQLRENGLTTYKRVSNRADKVYNGKIYQDLLDRDGNASGFRMYWDPNNKNDVILQMPSINSKDSSGKNLKLPPEIAEILMDPNSD